MVMMIIIWMVFKTNARGKLFHMLINTAIFLLSINHIKNSNKYGGIDEKEDNDINMNA